MKKTATTDTPVAQPTTTADWAVNSVRIVGRLAADPTVRATSSGDVATLRVATNNTRFPEFHDVVLWGAGAEGITSCFQKGAPIHVEGRLRTRTWTGRDGGTRRTTEIVANAVLPFSPPAA